MSWESWEVNVEDCSKTDSVKEADRSYKEILEEKISNQLKEAMRVVNEKLNKSKAARAETEKKLSEIQTLSSDEIRKLREQLKKAERETASLRTELRKK